MSDFDRAALENRLKRAVTDSGLTRGDTLWASQIRELVDAMSFGTSFTPLQLDAVGALVELVAYRCLNLSPISACRGKVSEHLSP